MNCKETQTRFDERLDGRLGVEDVAAFAGHLASCAACRQQWQEYSESWEALARHESIEPSFGFAERTVRRLSEATTVSRPWFWQPVVRWATLVVALAALGVGGWLIRQHILDARRAQLYSEVQRGDYLEDYDVIAFLDQLNGENKL